MANRNRLTLIIVGVILILIYFVSVIPYSGRVNGLLILIGLLVLSPVLGGKRFISTDKIILFWILTLIIIVVSMLRTRIDQFYLLFYIAMILFLLLSDDKSNWMLFIINVSMVLGALYAVFTIIQVVAGDFYLNKLYPLLQYNSTFDPARYMKFGIYSGFTYQTAVNSFYLAIGIGATFCSFLYTKNGKAWKLILIASEAICIMLSAKRGHLVFGALSLLIVAYYSSNRGKRIRNILIAGVFMFIIFLIAYSLVPAVSYFFDRISDAGGDITNGRLTLYIEALEQFERYPIFGIGWEQFRYSYTRYTDVHNIYLQLLCETGIVGAGVFIAAFITMIMYTIKKINILALYNITSQSKYLLLFSLFCQFFFLLYGFTGNPLYDYYILAVYFLGSAIAIRCREKIEVDI